MPPTKQKHLEQDEFWLQTSICHETIIAKLDAAGRPDLVGRMRDCHQAILSLTCVGCGVRRLVSNRCEKRWCPICAARLARERREQLTWWIATLKQPKHVVLTCRNTEQISRQRVGAFRTALRKLRNQKLASEWKSGVWSLEVTNESRGWHLHAHLLVESRWIDPAELSSAWAKLVGQDFAILKVKDARKEDYLRELIKYVVKSSQLASWSPDEIVSFMDAFTGTRTFGVFGTLSGERSRWKQELRGLRRQRGACECGCRKFHIQDARLDELNHQERCALHKPRVDAGAVVRTHRNHGVNEGSSVVRRGFRDQPKFA